MARVLVTGATGFIGKHLTAHLRARGDAVRCLIHHSDARIAGIDCVRGDITVPSSFAAALRDIDIVYHLAGATVVASPHRYRVVNTLGTRNIAMACARLATPPVLVFLSSLAAAGPTSPDQPLREDDSPNPVSEYGRSKLFAERHLRRLARQLPITIVRPPGVFGPGDPNTLKLFQAARRGINLIPGSAEQRLSFIYVDDLVAALPQAAERGERLTHSDGALYDPRGVYFLTMDDRPTVIELGELAGRAMGIGSIRHIRIPAWAIRLAAGATDFSARVTMRPMLLTSDKMREALAGSWICASAKAKSQLGFVCLTGLVDGFAKTVAWYKQHGWL